tara:strand:- start:18787 stop:20094 length:1308 start_codon:yes stop_codon:yes gene_type:complete
MNSLINSFRKQIKLHPWKVKSYFFQAYLIQALTFFYTIYRYLSRSYESYGFLPHDSFTYPRWWLADLYPLPLSHFSTLQFIYRYIPHIDADLIAKFQYFIVIFAFFGLIGFLPRISAIISFLLTIHLEGILISADAEISGGTILFLSLLLIAISPKDALYRLWKFNPINDKSEEASFLIFSFSLIIGIWYFSAGVNKLVDIGLNWPFTLNIHWLAKSVQQKQFLFNQRLSYPSFTLSQLSPILSVFSGFFTLISELGSILFITKFRYKYIIVFFLISMHTAVYFLAAINFTGNTILLLGILNWNSLCEKEIIIFDDKCRFCQNSINFIKKFIKPKNLKYMELSKVDSSQFDLKKNGMNEQFNIRRARQAIALISENDLMYGYNTISNILVRSPFFLVGLLMYLPPINLLGILIYKIIAKNRYLLSGKCESDNCQI